MLLAGTPVSAEAHRHLAGGVGFGDGGVVGVQVGVPLQRVGEVLDRVDRDEALQRRVVVPRTDPDQPRGVLGATDEGAFPGPVGRRCATGLAVGVLPGRGEFPGRVQHLLVGGALPVRDQGGDGVVAGAGTHREGLSGVGVVPQR